MEIILSSLPKIITNRKKRLGRGLGSGKGAKSTRGGTRHQKAREKIPLHFEGGQAKLTKKFPLLRGKGKNKSVRKKPLIIFLKDLNQFAEGEIVDVKSLIEKKIIKTKNKKIKVKILAKGDLNKKLRVKLPVSQSVKSIVEKAGGEVQPV
ncbi:MAG: 50S ribosomal protein L15 [Candidatus Roizmanbacteria bacterium]|nr:MAG: 50S ribosomal protein L15 [Candidatus Roizmanbacteria bacterium]